MGDQGLNQAEAVSEEAAFVVVGIDHARALRIPLAMLDTWNRHGWPEDHVLDAMFQEERFRAPTAIL